MAVKKLRTVLALVALTGAALAAYWLQNPSGKGKGAASPDGARAGDAQPAGVQPKGAQAGGRAGKDGPVAVEVGRAESATLQDDAQAVGTLRSRQGVMLRPEVSGRVVRLDFQDGQPVRRGQVLVQLDDSLQKAQLQQSQAQAGIAGTSLQRNRELQAQGFVSQSVVDQSIASMQVAQAQVALAQAQLDRMRIVAPFGGVAGIRAVNVGDYVKDGADLVNLEDTSSMWVDFRLPERVLGRVKAGQSVSVAFESLPQRSFAGRVEALDSQVDANGRSVLVRARLDNPGGQLKPGMFARTGIVFSRREGAVVVPEEALVPLGGKQFVFKVEDAPGGGKVSRRIEARVGLRVPGKVEVLGGLAPGDAVVTAGQSGLLQADGVRLKVVELDAKPAAAGGAASAAASGTVAEGAPAPAPAPAAKP